MAQAAAQVRGNGRWLRGTSYPEMQEATLRGLFGVDELDAGLRALLGFGVEDAIAFLNTCHQMQMEQLNARGQGLAEVFNSIDMSSEHVPTEGEKTAAQDALTRLFNPLATQAAISMRDIEARTGLSADIAEKVTGFFAAVVPFEGSGSALRAHLHGNSPLRAHPLVRRGEWVMLVHPVLIGDAIKAGFEDSLKSSSLWDTYAAHRGKYLEGRIAGLFCKLIPGITAYHSIEYFIPANESEEAGEPDGYTKLVEGDHLFVLHDVAFIVEDKAIPLGDRSRTGDLHPLRRNLTDAIKGGAAQAGRMRRRIVADNGLRLRGGGWLDLSDVREVHAIVTSLDDMPGIATATAKLIGAGLLSPDDIPWTVSLNDLDLIAQLVDRPAELLLYVRRRTERRATELYMAVDEMDLFLLFFRMGLYVEPDPRVRASEMPWLGPPSSADLRRYKQQRPALVTSQTDELDAWYNSLHTPAGMELGDVAPKPQMVPSPLAPLVDWLHSNNIFGWLSIGATLLEGSSQAQHQLAAYPATLTGNPSANGEPRSLAVPWVADKEPGWLLVWMTRPNTFDVRQVVKRAHAYMVAKRHQLGLLRGAAFVYDEPTGELVGASYDSGQTVLGPDVLDGLIASLRPAGDFTPAMQLVRRGRAASKPKSYKRSR